MRQEVQETRILLVEDDRSICGMVCDYLAGEGYRVEAFYNGRSAIRAFPDRQGDALALIDLMLPDVDGMEVIRYFRQTSTIPIIIITAKDDDADKAMGLNLGADDYVVKPFSLIELAARIRANIRSNMTEADKRPSGSGILKSTLQAAGCGGTECGSN